MALNDFITFSLKSMEANLGNPTFIWKGETFICVPNTINDGAKAVDVGFDEDGDFRMTVRLNQFSTGIYPALNDFITYQGYKLLIKRIKKPAHNQFWVYEAELPKVGSR